MSIVLLIHFIYLHVSLFFFFRFNLLGGYKKKTILCRSSYFGQILSDEFYNGDFEKNTHNNTKNKTTTRQTSMGNVELRVFGDILSYLVRTNVGQDDKLDVNRAKVCTKHLNVLTSTFLILSCFTKTNMQSFLLF